ncbi:hypothetical protein S40285_04672 [Stachybotrys chlorohalonatus IBT 40285]|uniref:Uncharacterized protein n=1 Tax=Stachybotrys chlorohalonatus (strain IBT 40285) TaxID=1283841 RepID=A0A084QPG7_STAC4|nr:hypothetical protein S40285_04672 [Stachybotrys chlorohalonata IBT 40285]
MAVQVGDVFNFGRLAWQIYELGWNEELNASRQYNEFGHDVRGLAESLDILEQVVSQAKISLRRQGPANALVRWDPTSLREIIGDYEVTLKECDTLIRTNNRYRMSSNPLRNIEWNVLVQPSVDRLRQRIVLHNSKVLHVLKPFEIDLLCRVREDIQRVHRDLTQQITAVRQDIYHLRGLLFPDLDEALHQQARREPHLLQVPIEIAQRFRFAALSDRPEYNSDDTFALQDLSDAFIFNYNRSTNNFKGGLLVTDKIPPVDQYLNLLKCIWLYKRIQTSPMLVNAGPDSHWPSYTRQLEDELSSECSRYRQELVEPDLVLVASVLTRDMFTIWPEEEQVQLIDVITKDEMMEHILETPLQSPETKVERSVKLLRRMGSDGCRFRVIVSGSEQATTSRAKHRSEVIDFDIQTVCINPQYALPTSNGMMSEILVQRDERIARLAFTSIKHLLEFQQAVTGYKAWASYVQYDAWVSFVVGGLREPLIEKACIQLWIPKQVDVSLVTNTEASSDLASTLTPTRSPTTVTTPSMNGNGSAYMRGAIDVPPMARTSRQSSLQAQPVPQTPSRGSAMFSISWPQRSSPPPIASSPPYQVAAPPMGNTRSSISHLTEYSTSPANLSPPRNGHRSFSISSAAAASHTSRSSGSDSGNTKVISTGTYATGLLHRRPPKPMLVLFTQNPKTQALSIVTINIDQEVAANPERCNCRRSGRDGSSCPIAAIECRKGNTNLEARRYEGEWTVSRLAANNPASSDAKSTWAGLKRISIKFPTSQQRAGFSGTPNQCRCEVKKEGELNQCINWGHRGLLGEVAEFQRRQMLAYHRQVEERKQVVNGLML